MGDLMAHPATALLTSHVAEAWREVDRAIHGEPSGASGQRRTRMDGNVRGHGAEGPLEPRSHRVVGIARHRWGFDGEAGEVEPWSWSRRQPLHLQGVRSPRLLRLCAARQD